MRLLQLRSSSSTHVVDGVHKESGSSLLHQDVTPKNFASLRASVNSVSTKSGTWYSYKSGEVFIKKRENLTLWVKTTSFPEIDELCSKGYGFVSVLLSRLNPMSNEDNDSTNLDRKQLDSSMSPKLHAYPQSDIQLKEFNQNCTWDFLEAEDGQYLDCSLSSGWLNKSMERNIPDYLPAVAALKTITWQESEDEFQASNKSLIEEEARDSEWGWVLNNKNKERDLGLVRQSRELTTAPALLTYRCNDRQQILESGFGGRELSAFSISSQYPSKFCSSLCHPSFHDDDIGTYYEPQTLQSGFVGSELPALFASSHYPSRYWPSRCQSTSIHNNDLERYHDQQTLESGFGGRESHAFPVSPHYPLQFSPPQIPSASFHNHDYETQYDRKEDIAIFSDLPCSLSRNLYSSCRDDFDDSCAVLLPPEQDQFINKGVSERHYHPLTNGFMHFLGCDSDLRLMCFSSTISSLGDHIFTNHTYPSPQDGEVWLSFLCGEDWYKRLRSSIQMNALGGFSRSLFTQIFNKEKAYPLLPDESSLGEGEVIVPGSKISKFDASWQF
ncbi:hypothetical protein BT93_K0515 [Corymbia citriodora subsp. variegata]|nr:hypothetical protein BT93_K0515 [Corymbia citriodora subsp. variegata]KAF8006249.1 hypothetical protein BT93_K0515 [Corymbia citriodora subsp. variegata]